LKDERSKRAVEVAERYADGLAPAKELDKASAAAWAVVWVAKRKRMSPSGRALDEQLPGPVPYSAAAYNVAIPVGWWGGAPAFVAPDEIILERALDREAEGTAQCRLLREIVGNPFRPVPCDPSWLTPPVKALGQSVNEEGRFQELPILADALEEAGCANPDLLAHCRHPVQHVRGCWALDLVLGKQ
jgi:hypothetical protein